MDRLSPKEIVEVAINVEEAGVQFYASLAKEAREEEIKNTWEFLSRQEEEHKKFFTGLLEEIDEYVVKQSSSNEYEAYFTALASNYIFTPQLIAKKIKEKFGSLVQALEFAIGIEHQSILTYYEFKKYLKKSKWPDIDQVIEEEKKHLVTLTLLKDKIEPRINSI